jgi:hypothetical protein
LKTGKKAGRKEGRKGGREERKKEGRYGRSRREGGKELIIARNISEKYKHSNVTRRH